LEANRSALKALFLNKIGDIGFYIFMIFFFFFFNNFDLIFVQSFITNFINIDFNVVDAYTQDILIIFLIVAAAAKSAQIGLHV
jgi:NADH:ubiquinone oxidoreductase subunit 5 (subunit L)/multisubunit Na+/H+ antiporter MnhA subunit